MRNIIRQERRVGHNNNTQPSFLALDAPVNEEKYIFKLLTMGYSRGILKIEGS